MRKFLRFNLIIILAFFVALFIRGFFIEPNLLTIKNLTIKVQNWQQQELKIAIISDLHVGSPFVGLKKLDTIVKTTNAQNPDIIFLLGDYVIQDVAFGKFIRPEPIARSLGRLKAPLGVIAILGNHDWWYDGICIKKALEDVGIPVLENNAVKLNYNNNSFWVAGLADLQTRKPDIDQSLKDIPNDDPIILLSHNPRTFTKVPPRVSLTLSGHTHGGQIDIPFAGSIINNFITGKHYIVGHILENERHLFISSGIGTSIFPARLGNVPEINIITLKSE